MSPPYRPGQALAWLRLEHDGIRVHRAFVQTIEPANATHWRVTTDRGTALVDDAGTASHVVPIDGEIAQELYQHGGTDYLVRPTYSDRACDLNRGQALDHDHTLDHDEDLDLDDGYGLD